MENILPCNDTSHLSVITLMETKEDRCEECGGKISSTAFTCILCNVWKHISCADKLNSDLPHEIVHPLHLQHRLQLEWRYEKDFICDKCLYVSTAGYRYICSSCDFNLDLTCASSASAQLPKDQEPLRFKDGKRKTISHYSHFHEMSFFKYRKKGDGWDSYCKAYCKACGKDCGGASVYRCVPCNFSLYLKCVVSSSAKHKYHRHPLMMELIKEDDSEEYYCDVCENERNPKDPDKVSLVKVPSSSPPPMEIKALFVDEMKQNEGTDVIRTLIRPIIHRHQMYEVTEELKRKTYCYGCRLVLNGWGKFAYSCEHCDFDLHTICANSLRRPLKCEFLQDDLYYFGRNHKSFNGSPFSSIKFDCCECDGRSNGEPFYRCLNDTVKSKYHIHPLILKDSFIEDDSAKYYCDFCEEERNPNDDIYYCQECNGQIIAHIECVLPEVNDYIEIRKNNHEERLRKKLQAIILFTKLLSNECRAPIEEVIQAGVIPRFVELLDSPNDDVRKMVAWALGKIASNSLRCRDQVIGHGALLPLLALLNEHAELPILRIATQSLSMFCEPPFDQVKLVLPTLARIIHSNDDESVLEHVCWALAYLCDATNDKIQAVIEADVCGRLVELLMHPSPSVIAPALYTIGRIVTHVQVQSVISRQALPCLLNLLTNNYKKSIKEFACSIISNIMVGNDEHIQAVIEANIIAPLVHLLQNAEFDIKKQAAWAISIATDGTHDQIRFLVSQGCIKPLCDFLNCPDPEVVSVCLQGLENILKVGEAEKNMGTTGKVNLYAQMIDAAKGREKIEYLRFHDNTNIYEKVVKVLETYW
ncbi:hypothetical protein PVK06_041170 [Gossypium arboreum]|uniref:Phorbol-ester/DAG-type domain-containing protein n=1 Tax=Gossypium arboreum TaxID=29729 RepID=A0ABR0N7G6_GOSAR|nr:hypothetical protein PVK06_041170 [Gossypium arboreum]